MNIYIYMLIPAAISFSIGSCVRDFLPSESIAVTMQSLSLQEAAKLLVDLKNDGIDVPPEVTAELVMQVHNIISKTEATGTGRTPAFEEIQDIFRDVGLGFEGDCPCDWVGVHPANRSGAGVGGSEAQVHGLHLLSRAGFSLKKASDATAFQSPPAHTEHFREAKAFNDKQCSLSDGLVPPLSKLILLSVGGTHTNTFCRQVKAAVKSIVPDLADESGHLNEEILVRGRPQFKQALTKGLKWFQMHWSTPFIWPLLPRLIENALNTEARKNQSEIEVMLYMHKLMVQQIEAGLTPNWSEIETNATASLPPCANYIGALTAYVKNNSGGMCGELLNDLVKFSKTFGCDEKGALRALGGEFIMAVANLNFGALEKYPFVKNSLFELNLQSNHLIDNICKFITPAIVKSLLHKDKRHHVKLCECVMQQARTISSTLNLKEELAIKSLGMLDVRCAGFLTGKGKALEGIDFNTVEEIEKAFLKDIGMPDANIKEGKLVAATEAEASEHAAPDEEDDPENNAAAPESLAEMKDMAFQAAKMGYKVNAYIVEKSAPKDQPDKIYQIVSMSSTAAYCKYITHLQSTSPAQTVINFETLMKEWSLYRKKVPYKHDLSLGEPMMSKEWAYEAAKGAAMAAVKQHFEKLASASNAVQLWQNPLCVRAGKDLQENKLKLAPASFHISRQPCNHGFLVAVFEHNGESKKLFMCSYSNFTGDKKWMSPYWHVGSTDKAKDANMEIHWESKVFWGVTVNIPTLVNSKAVLSGDLLLKPKSNTSYDQPPEEPPLKKAKKA